MDEKYMGHYRFDLRKALSTAHCQYFLRLAMALNDLLSVQQLMHLDLSNQTSQVSTGLGIYLTKLHAGHVVESYIAFVEKIRPSKKTSGGSDLYQFLISNDRLKDSFCELERILEDKRFISLRRVRNSFAFHFNYENDGKDTMEAVTAMLASRNKNKDPEPDVGLIIRTQNFLTDRFYFADDLVVAGWLNFAEVQNPSCDSGKDEMRMHIRFVGEATVPFLRFATDGILEWIVENKLQLPNPR